MSAASRVSAWDGDSWKQAEGVGACFVSSPGRVALQDRGSVTEEWRAGSASLGVCDGGDEAEEGWGESVGLRDLVARLEKIAAVVTALDHVVQSAFVLDPQPASHPAKTVMRGSILQNQPTAA